MPSFYLAPALSKLRSEVDAANSKRDRRSDGWVGDTRHNAKKSDHNPDYPEGGVVRALDVDKDGIDANKLAHIAIQDSRVNYVIWNGHIWSRAFGFKKRVYTGVNKHTGHVHISLRHGKRYENDSKRWGYTPTVVAPVAQPVKSARVSPAELQRAVRTTADGLWGPTTDKRCNAVVEASKFGEVDFPYGVGFTQQVVGVSPDGKWGPQSEAAHAATVKNMQAALKSMGFDPGSADGEWGSKTQAAYVAARNSFRR